MGMKVILVNELERNTNILVVVNVLDFVLGNSFMGVCNRQNSYSEHLIFVHFIECKLYLNLKAACSHE